LEWRLLNDLVFCYYTIISAIRFPAKEHKNMWFSATYILAHMLFSEICSKHQTNPYRPNPISKYVTAYQFCTTLHILPTEGKAYIEEKFKKEKSTSDVAKHTKHASAIGKAPTQFQAALNAGDGRRD
jgi:hypothetical protein